MLPKKETSIALRLPATMRDWLVRESVALGIPTSQFIRSILSERQSRPIKTAKMAPKPSEPKELALSPEVRVLWDAWEGYIAPITTHQGFQRNALSSMRKKYGESLVLDMIRLVASAHADRFAPKDVKPFNPKQLEERWDAIYAWGRSKHVQAEANKPVRI